MAEIPKGGTLVAAGPFPIVREVTRQASLTALQALDSSVLYSGMLGIAADAPGSLYTWSGSAWAAFGGGGSVDFAAVAAALATADASVDFNGQELTNLADPTNPQSAANLKTVNNYTSTVAASATGNVTLSSTGAVIDGYTVANGDRIACFHQTTATQNGIYQASGGGWTRVADMAVSTHASGHQFWALNGTANGGKLFTVSNLVSADVVGTNTLTVVQQSGGAGVVVWDATKTWTQVYAEITALGGGALVLVGRNCTITAGAYDLRNVIFQGASVSWSSLTVNSGATIDAGLSALSVAQLNVRDVSVLLSGSLLATPGMIAWLNAINSTISVGNSDAFNQVADHFFGLQTFLADLTNTTVTASAAGRLFSTSAGGAGAAAKQKFICKGTTQLVGSMSVYTGEILVTEDIVPPFTGNGSTQFPSASAVTITKSRGASGLANATATVDVSAATAPTAGQVLTATSGTAATWQTPGGGGVGTFAIIYSSTPADNVVPLDSTGGALTLKYNAVGTAQTTGLLLENTTVDAGGAPQFAPSIEWQGHNFYSGADRTIKWRLQPHTTNADYFGSLRLYSAGANGTWYPALDFGQTDTPDPFLASAVTPGTEIVFGNNLLISASGGSVLPTGAEHLGSSARPWGNFYLNGDITLSKETNHVFSIDNPTTVGANAGTWNFTGASTQPGTGLVKSGDGTSLVFTGGAAGADGGAGAGAPGSITLRPAPGTNGSSAHAPTAGANLNLGASNAIGGSSTDDAFDGAFGGFTQTFASDGGAGFVNSNGGNGGTSKNSGGGGGNSGTGASSVAGTGGESVGFGGPGGHGVGLGSGGPGGPLIYRSGIGAPANGVHPGTYSGAATFETYDGGAGSAFAAPGGSGDIVFITGPVGTDGGFGYGSATAGYIRMDTGVAPPGHGGGILIGHDNCEGIVIGRAAIPTTLQGDSRFTYLLHANGGIDVSADSYPTTGNSYDWGRSGGEWKNVWTRSLQTAAGLDLVVKPGGALAATFSGTDQSLALAGNVEITGKIKWAAAGNEQTTVGAAGGAAALPVLPTKYLKVLDSTGTTYVIPAYAAA